MSEHEDQSDRLKQHFAQRVINQARQVLEVWQRLQRNAWSKQEMDELQEGNQRLLRYAERFEQPEHCQIAEGIEQCLQGVAANRNRLSSELICELNQLMQRLSRTGLRHGDQFEQTSLPPLRKPVYLALQDNERRLRLEQQLSSYGLIAQGCPDSQVFRQAMAARHPLAILRDVDFAGDKQGLLLAEEAQQGLEQRIPVLFFSEQDSDTATRLQAVRAGGLDFYCNSLDASTILERVEQFSHTAHYEPFKVLIIDDSRAQVTHTEMVLNSAGIVTRTLTEPLEALDVLADFNPELIILDMYMPGCVGTELAKVIRQHERYVSIPIIYLSAEDDLEKQLDAMSEGGDDFLTKPIKPRHLIATVRTRATRARSLQARMVRDSLTGLSNHTHPLQLLEDARLRASRDGQPLCFAMLDIDHFKKVNDNYGHPMGDRVIKSLALFLKQRLRKTDHIGRYGGEEFAVVLPDTELEAAQRVLDEIRRRFAEIHYPAQPEDLSCTFSGGIALLRPGEDAQSLSKRADEALYQAKHGGRNQIACAE